MTDEPVEGISYSFATSVNGLEEENRFLKETVEGLKQEIGRFKQKPLLVCKLKEHYGESALIKLSNGNEFVVGVSVQADELKSGDTVLAEQKNLTVVSKADTTKKFDVTKYVIIEKPTVTWDQIGGLAKQQREVTEVIELPLMKPKLFEKVGIQPPKGILLYGPPGTGKTLLAKAVAASTNATFIEIVASELVQKFIGEGAKLVKEIFELAREKQPAIVFIDEIDALAATRMEIGTSGEREVQRTFMQLLAEIDGFKNLDNVKIIGCTNRKDILDPAITRPGRLDRIIRVDHPDKEGRAEIFKIHSASMNLTKSVKPDALVHVMTDFSGAEIKSACTEAGYFAIRRNKHKVSHDDFLNAIEKVKEEKELGESEFKQIFG